MIIALPHFWRLFLQTLTELEFQDPAAMQGKNQLNASYLYVDPGNTTRCLHSQDQPSEQAGV